MVTAEKPRQFYMHHSYDTMNIIYRGQNIKDGIHHPEAPREAHIKNVPLFILRNILNS